MSDNGHEKPFPAWLPTIVLVGALVIGATVLELLS
jgi:hypothetical protein